MTHSPSSAALLPVEAPRSRAPLSLPTLHGNRSGLATALAARRAAIAGLEAAWVAAAEADAGRNAARHVRIHDRGTWDRPTWDRYLAAASAHEPDYKPRIKRLLQEIDCLEMLLAVTEPSRAEPCRADRLDGRARVRLAVERDMTCRSPCQGW